MGNASRFLSGNLSFWVSCSGSSVGVSVPQSAKPGLYRCVVAGTKGCIPKRWNGSGGGKRCVPGNAGVQSASGSVSLEKVSTFCSGSGHPGAMVQAETDFDCTESEPSAGVGARDARA